MAELFGLPFLTGVVLATMLPLVGVWLRLRDEWLAALAVAHLAGAGAVLALSLALPALLGSLALAVTGMLGRHFPGAGNSAYAWLILVGWTVTLLVAANSPLGETLARQLIDGQLYFTGAEEFLAALILLMAILGLRAHIDRNELATRLLPATTRTEERQRRHTILLTDTLVAAALAAGTLSIGLMATFALVFLPAWATFRKARNWRRALLGAVALGQLGYLVAFAAALEFDQPFAPILVAVLLGLTTAARLLPARPC